jgi:tagaturonate epimerase
MELEKYSMGIGDRFGFQCSAQLRALQKAAESGIRIVPVWNKSNREHGIAGTVPEDARKAADEAVRACRWTDSYYVDADHIGTATVDAYLPSHNFFTIDVADSIGKPVRGASRAPFLAAMARYRNSLAVPGIPAPLQITDLALEDFARKYLFAISEAGKIYRHIAERKGAENFVTEISMDEAQSAQNPVELLMILAAVALEAIPIQTIALKFTGAFLKGVDYVGDLNRFTKEFHDDLAVIAFAVDRFHLPGNLKLSIHTGSDKFSLYPIMHDAIKSIDTGIHLKTAGTTWLEEITGMAASSRDGLALAKDIYEKSCQRYDELCSPYLAVIRIDRHQIPAPARVASWSAEEFVQALRHEPLCKNYNPHLRQLMHLGFKVAAEMGPQMAELRRECRSIIEENVTTNIYERHIRPLFLGLESNE